MSESTAAAGAAASAEPSPASPEPQNEPKLDSLEGEAQGGTEEGLPGVIKRKDKGDEQLRKLFDVDGDRKMVPQRGPDGRFVSREDRIEAELAGVDVDAPPEPKVEGAPEGDQKPDAPPDTTPQQKVKFLGKDYNSIADVEQVHRTLQGLHRRLTDDNKALTADRDEGYRRGNEWYQRYQATQAELDALRAGTPPSSQPNGSAPAPPSGDGKEQPFDYDAFEYLATHGSLAQAAQYLWSEFDKTMEARLAAKLAETSKTFEAKLNPFMTERANSAEIEAMTQVTQSVASLRTMEGQPAFPELTNGETLFAVGQVWGEAAKAEAAAVAAEGGDAEAVLRARQAALRSPQGLIQAVALYRLYKGLPAEGSAAPAAAPELPNVPVAPGAAASVATDGRTPFAPGSFHDDTPLDVRALVAELRKGPEIDRNLGFARNR